MKKTNVLKLVTVAMLTAIAFALYMFEIPLIFSCFVGKKISSSVWMAVLVAMAGIYMLCFSGGIGGIYLGPVAGVMIEFMKNLIHVFTKGLGSTMGFGDLMNFIVGSAYIVPFVLCYNAFSKKMKKAVAILISAVIGCVALVALGAAANYFIAPLYFKYFVGQIITEEFLMTYLVSATSLNIVKGAILSVVAYPVIFLLLDKIKKVSSIG